MDVSFSESGVRQANRLYLSFLPQGSYRVLKFVQLFSRPGKRLEEVKSGKNDKKSWVFFSNLRQVLYKWIFSFLFFFNLIQPLPHVCRAPRKKLCSYVLRSLLITCLITLSLEKEIIVLEKVLEKVHPALRVTSFFICFFFSIVPHAYKDGWYRE